MNVYDAEIGLDELQSLIGWRIRGLSIHESDNYEHLLKENSRKENGKTIKTKSFIDSDISYVKLIEELNNNTNSYYYPGIFNTPIYNGKIDEKMQVYKMLNEKFNAKIIKQNEINYSSPIGIPPISTLVLSRANGINGIKNELFSLREEFGNYRQNFNSYQIVIGNSSHQTLTQLKSQADESFYQINNSLQNISERKYSNIWFERYMAELISSSNEAVNLKGGLNFPSLLKLEQNGVQIDGFEGCASILSDIYNRIDDIKDNFKLYENTFKIKVEQTSVVKISNYQNFVNSHTLSRSIG